MKNLFFTLAFMLVASFTFANNNTTNEFLNANTIEVTEEVSQTVEADVIIVVTTIITDYYDAETGEYLGSTIEQYVDVYIIE